MMSVKETLKVISTSVIFFLSMFPAQHAIAADEVIYPLITYKCNPASDIVIITNKLLDTEEGKTFKYSDADGTYSPWDMVEIDRSTKDTKITKTSRIKKTCKLSSGEYTITIEPQPFGRKLTGKCGASISAAVTITYDGIDILERTPFEDFCKGNAPVIIRVTAFGKTSDVKIKRIPKYKFY